MWPCDSEPKLSVKLSSELSVTSSVHCLGLLKSPFQLNTKLSRFHLQANPMLLLYTKYDFGLPKLGKDISDFFFFFLRLSFSNFSKS